MTRLTPPRNNTGGYSNPFSGVGVEFFPLGLAADSSGVVLHEAGYLTQNSDWNFRNVFSPYWRLIYDEEAGHQIRYGGRTAMLGPDRLVLAPAHIYYDFEEIRPVPTFWLHFTCVRQLPAPQQVPLFLNPEPLELELIQALSGQINASGKLDRQRISGLSAALLSVVLSRPDLHWQETTLAGIQRVVEEVQTHYAEPLYNHQLARAGGFSLRSFNRQFRRHQGVSAAQFVVQVRVREAAHLLANTELNLEEISARTGFPDAAYFSRAFKQKTGRSPSLFRRLARTSPPS
ncbi:MAG: AraC family transcriptional regulator [Verrucomicrobia bacterium]|nr:AraC family transcriptional regulator [Verrucomicrobiota bacterium]